MHRKRPRMYAESDELDTWLIEQWRSRWRMPDTPEGLHLTKVWLEGNKTQNWFCQAFAVPAVYEAVPGVMLIRSTKHSKEVYHCNHARIKASKAITQPHWYHYSVNWFPQAKMLDWTGMSNAYCDRKDEYLGSLDRLLDRIAPEWQKS
jgi:hypothetical protein